MTAVGAIARRRRRGGKRPAGGRASAVAEPAAPAPETVREPPPAAERPPVREQPSGRKLPRSALAATPQARSPHYRPDTDTNYPGSGDGWSALRSRRTAHDNLADFRSTEAAPWPA
ncbi:MAG: hypothetical protein MZV65_37730 [Chromatiales bacterium]|nr:hypothetical protein [Chromatiales bacterium]